MNNPTETHTLLLVADMDWSEFDAQCAEDEAMYYADLADDAEAERMFGPR